MNESFNIKISMLGCAIETLGLILLIFLLTHLGEIWVLLENLLT